MDNPGKSYWTDVWERTPLPGPIDAEDCGVRNYPVQKFHEFFCLAFSTVKTQGKKLLEIGCARSAWLPYFGKEFGFQIYGIDYSEIGCRQARQLLLREKIRGEIVCGDFFSPPESLIGKFDVVISFGVAEHFENPSLCLRAFTKFLKTGGLLITNIPNMLGLNGFLQKILNRSVFDIHIGLSRDDLAHAHRITGLRVISCNYFLFSHFGMLNINNLKGRLFYPLACRLRTVINVSVWILERMIPAFKPNGWSSPYINCLAVKEDDRFFLDPGLNGRD